MPVLASRPDLGMMTGRHELWDSPARQELRRASALTLRVQEHATHTQRQLAAQHPPNTPDPDKLKKLIIAHATKHNHYVAASNPITKTVGLIPESAPLVHNFHHSARLTRMANKAFYEQYTVLERSLDEASGIFGGYKREIRRLFVAIELAGVSLHEMLKDHLRESERLEWLCVAFELPEKQKKMKVKETGEVRAVVDALDELEVKSKFVVVKTHGDEPEVSGVEVSTGGEAKMVVKELLAVDVGVALHLF